jgi:hypothetical protein
MVARQALRGHATNAAAIRSGDRHSRDAAAA